MSKAAKKATSLASTPLRFYPELSRKAPRLIARSYATPTANKPPPSSSSSFTVFDRNAKREQRNRAAKDKELSRLTDYVKDEVAANLVDRLLDIKRRFPIVMDLGSGAGHIVKHLDPEITQKVVMVDSADKMLYRDEDIPTEVLVERVVADEEQLPFEENSHDAILSNFALHWVNDLVGTLIQIRNTLRPDGVFIGAMIGGDTLFELRTSLQLAEIEREGGISPRVSPMADSRTLSSLLTRAGFALTTVDVDEVKVHYPSMFELVEDLRAMGESNAVMNRRPFIHRDTLMAASAIYKELHGEPDGSIPATFQITYLIGWKPAPNQPKPLERGSGSTNLKDVFGEPKDPNEHS